MNKKVLAAALAALSLAGCATQAQMQAQAISDNSTSAISAFQACTDAIIASPDFDPIRARTPLDARKATLEQLTQTNKITKAERTAVFKSYDKVLACRQTLLAQLQVTTPTITPSLAAAYAKNDEILIALLDGKISWGEELQRAKQLSAEITVQLTAESQRINAGLQQYHEAELARRQQARPTRSRPMHSNSKSSTT